MSALDSGFTMVVCAVLIFMVLGAKCFDETFGSALLRAFLLDDIKRGHRPDILRPFYGAVALGLLGIIFVVIGVAI